jgi:hypothetical protein
MPTPVIYLSKKKIHTIIYIIIGTYAGMAELDRIPKYGLAERVRCTI